MINIPLGQGRGVALEGIRTILGGTGPGRDRSDVGGFETSVPGNGTLELAGTNTYTGVNVGTLQLGDGINSTSLAGTNGGTGSPGGAGTVAVTLNNSATFNVMANATVTGGTGGAGGVVVGGTHGFYLDGGIYGGHDVYSSSRATLGGMANGGTGGEEYSAYMSSGYDFHCGHLTIGPTAALQYT